MLINTPTLVVLFDAIIANASVGEPPFLASPEDVRVFSSNTSPGWELRAAFQLGRLVDTRMPALARLVGDRERRRLVISRFVWTVEIWIAPHALFWI